MAITITQALIGDGTAQTIKWAGMATGESGAPVEFVPFERVTAQVLGTFGGSTVTIEGSNDGTNWSTLSNQAGTALSLTSAAVKVVAERPQYIRPTVTGGSGVSVTVILCMYRQIPSRL